LPIGCGDREHGAETYHQPRRIAEGRQQGGLQVEAAGSKQETFEQEQGGENRAPMRRQPAFRPLAGACQKGRATLSPDTRRAVASMDFKLQKQTPPPLQPAEPGTFDVPSDGRTAGIETSEKFASRTVYRPLVSRATPRTGTLVPNPEPPIRSAAESFSQNLLLAQKLRRGNRAANRLPFSRWFGTLN
jgi:hypothetical protein